MAFPGAGAYGSQQHQNSYPPSGPPMPMYGQGFPPPQQQQYPPQGYAPFPSQSPQYPPQSPPPPQGYGYQSPPPPMYNGGYQQPPPPNYGYNQPGPQGGPPPPQYGGRPPMPNVNSNSYVHGNPNAPPPPPQTMQSFGNGAPTNYGYQYSSCTGSRKALLVGINYFGQRGQLRGCINDVKNMSTYLNNHFNYKREDMVILTDDQQNPMSQPTKQNILRAMHWLVKDAKPDDSLFFHYSGHGGQTPDLDGDEDDGYDEVIYPVDFRVNGHIVDDEMHLIMVKSLPPGVRLTAIFDSCHSGSALDLPYIYSTQGVLKEPNLAKEAGQGLLGIVSAYARGDMGGMASTAMGFFKKATTGDSAYEKALQTKTSPADVIMWSGSKDEQTSQDAQIGGEATGAMSWAFITALKKNPQQSYVQLLNNIRDELASKYTQKPQLSCSHPLGETDFLSTIFSLPSQDLCIFCATRLHFSELQPFRRDTASRRLIQSSTRARRPAAAAAAVQEDVDGVQHVDRVIQRRPSLEAPKIIRRPRLPWNVPREEPKLSPSSAYRSSSTGFGDIRRLVPEKKGGDRTTGVPNSDNNFEDAAGERAGNRSKLQPSGIGLSTNPLNARGGWTSDASAELTQDEEKIKQELSRTSQVPMRELSFHRRKPRERAWPEKRWGTRQEASNRSLDEKVRKVDTAKESIADETLPERYGDYKCIDCGRRNKYQNNKVCFNCHASPPDHNSQTHDGSEIPGLDHLVLRRFGSWDCSCGETNYPTRKACHFCGKHRDLSRISSQIAQIEDGVVLKDVVSGIREDGIETAWQWKHLRRRTNAEGNSQLQVRQESQEVTSDIAPESEARRIVQERADRLQQSQDGKFVGFLPTQDYMPSAEQKQTRINSPLSERTGLEDWQTATSATNGSWFQEQQDWSDTHQSLVDYSSVRTVQPESRVQQAGPDTRAPKWKMPETSEDAEPIAKTYRGLQSAPDRNRAKDRQRAQRNTRDSYNDYDDIDEATVSRIERKRQRKKEKLAEKSLGPPTPILLPEYISIGNLAAALRVRAEDFTSKMRSLGFDETSNDHVLDAETAGLIASEFNFEPIALHKENAVEDLVALAPAEDKTFLLQRPPVITIMGHVDHGKTTLLDWLRKSSVAASEHGGITQHIGAFTVPMPSGKIITFLDTPGHAAFLSMRQRGANVTDIVILVVAADDSVKPQTIEAIKHAQAAKVPMIVAINKIDKPDSDIERVKQDLARHGVDIEDFGGETQVVCVSGKTGQGMEELEDSAVALADILDMRAETDGQAEGWVLEATTRKAGRVATVLVRRGTIVPGSVLVAGSTWARVRSLRNEAGVSISSVGPGTPVEIDGWREQPEAGDEVLQAPDEQRAKAVVELRLARAEKEKMATDVLAVNEARRLEQEKREEAASADSSSDTKAKTPPQSTGIIEIPFIIRGDVSGSVEAVVNSISSLGNSEVRPIILRSAVGPIAPTDVDHAAVAKGHIISFNTPVDGTIRRMAEAAGVSILDQNIIYRLTDDVKAKLEEVLPALLTTRVVGEAEVAEVFEINVKGRVTVPIAGCRIRNGVISRGTKIRVLRDGEVVYDGFLSSLKNQKKDVTEMRKGGECGMGFEGFSDFKAGDQVQCYEEKSEKRRL
ncbi:hypothetical protein MMC11_003431 [Xylographa trunciseda]|nr:hypothetical protein [Xylographa trunciseda]